jgi:hypothetical protein
MAKDNDKENIDEASKKTKSGAEDSSKEPNYLEPGESGRYAGTTFGATGHSVEGASGLDEQGSKAHSSDQIGQEPNFEMPTEGEQT